MPKFRGGSDDWLDSEDAGSGRSRLKKKKTTQPTWLDPGEVNATVAEVFPNQCRVKLDDGREALCNYRRSSVFGAAQVESEGDAPNAMRERAPVAVGDRVLVDSITGQHGVVGGRCKRANQLLRPAPDRQETTIHVIVANIDLLVIVTAAKDPEFSPGLVDRILVAAGSQGITPLICVNKIDLLEQATGRRPWRIYRELGIEVIELSAKQGRDTDRLATIVAGKSVAFCGHSGVGKTSLLRKLLGADIGKVGEVSGLTGKGRHTTTSAVLLGGPEGSRWIDTPGVREFGLFGVKRDQILRYFPELAPGIAGCENANCQHNGEEGCLAVGLERHASYRRILDSLNRGEY